MPKLSPKAQSARRAHILDAAERCFVRAGFHGASMHAICREAGVSAGALYVYFSSKEELIEGLSERDREQVREEVARAAAGDDLVEGLARVLQTSAIAKPLDKVRLLIEMGAQASRSPAVSATLRACDADIRGALAETLTQAKARGQIAPAMPVDDLAALLMMVVDGLFWRRATDPDFDAAAMAPHVLAMFAAVMGVEENAARRLIAAFAEQSRSGKNSTPVEPSEPITPSSSASRSAPVQSGAAR